MVSERARRALLVGAVAALVGLVGCNSYVRRGSTLYADGRYIEAAEVFERTEGRLDESTPREKAEYGLYRGLTLLVLGDLNGAHHWLEYAYRVEQRQPGVLRGNRRALLDRGWYELGLRMRSGAPVPATVPPNSAVATTGAPAPDKPAPPPPERSDDAPSVQHGFVPR